MCFHWGEERKRSQTPLVEVYLWEDQKDQVFKFNMPDPYLPLHHLWGRVWRPLYTLNSRQAPMSLADFSNVYGLYIYNVLCTI